MVVLFNAFTNDTFSHCSSDTEIEATNCGGDADSIASMSGGLLASKHPDSLPSNWRVTVQERNDLDLDTPGQRTDSNRGKEGIRQGEDDAMTRAPYPYAGMTFQWNINIFTIVF